MTAPRAIDFRAVAEARYRRTSLPWGPPVTAILRPLPRMLRIENRVLVDARTLRLLAAAPQRGPMAVSRIERGSEPILTRLVERARRDETASADLTRSRQVAARSAPPVPMVLTRPTTGAAPIVSTSSIVASDGWSAAATGHRGPSSRPSADTAPELSRVDVNQLTERVVAAIDRRMLAARERFGS